MPADPTPDVRTPDDPTPDTAAAPAGAARGAAASPSMSTSTSTSPSLERRATALLLLLAALVLGSIVFVLHARGVFEPTQHVVLLADDSEGVSPGLDVTFSGFPIGRVRRTELARDGSVRIVVDVPRRDAHWLRSSSIFTLTRSLVGGTAIKAYSGVPTDPPLPDGAERRVLAGDAAAEIPRLLADVRALLANLTALTAADSALAGSLANTQRLTATAADKLAGPRGALDLLLGDEAPRLLATLDQARRLMASVDGVVRRADERLLGDQGLAADTQAAVRQLNSQLGGLLTQAQGSLTRVDRVLQDTEAVARQARIASADLGALRAEVDASLRQVERLVADINRLWPLKRDTEVKLP